MYIKYYDQSGTLHIESLNIAITETGRDEDEIIYSITNNSSNKKHIDMIESLLDDFMHFLEKEQSINVDTYYSIRHKSEKSKSEFPFGTMYIGNANAEFLYKHQLVKFMNILQTAIKNGDKLFDVTSISADELGFEIE